MLQEICHNADLSVHEISLWCFCMQSLFAKLHFLFACCGKYCHFSWKMLKSAARFFKIPARLQNAPITSVPIRKNATCQWSEAKSCLATFLASVLEALLRLILRGQTGHATSDLFIPAIKQAVPKPQHEWAIAPVDSDDKLQWALSFHFPGFSWFYRHIAYVTEVLFVIFSLQLVVSHKQVE